MPTANVEPTAQDVWNEELAKREGETAADAAATSDTKAEADAPAASDVTENSTATTDPAADPAADTNTGETDPATEGQVTPDPAPDPDPIMQELRERFDKLESRQRNVEGHIGGLKTAQQAMHQAMEAARKAAPQAEAPTQKQVEQAAASSEKWKNLKRDFPEWADATEELLSARLNGQAQPAAFDPEEIDRKVQESLGKVLPGLRQEIIDSTLDGLFPGWKQEVKTDAFKAWFEKADKDTQALVESDSVGDAATMLRLYNDAKKADPSAQIVSDRKQKLENAVGLPKGVRATPVKTVDQMTDAELWEYEARKREERRAKSGL